MVLGVYEFGGHSPRMGTGCTHLWLIHALTSPPSHSRVGGTKAWIEWPLPTRVRGGLFGRLPSVLSQAGSEDLGRQPLQVSDVAGSGTKVTAHHLS